MVELCPFRSRFKLQFNSSELSLLTVQLFSCNKLMFSCNKSMFNLCYMSCNSYCNEIRVGGGDWSPSLTVRKTGKGGGGGGRLAIAYLPASTICCVTYESPLVAAKCRTVIPSAEQISILAPYCSKSRQMML